MLSSVLILTVLLGLRRFVDPSLLIDPQLFIVILKVTRGDLIFLANCCCQIKFRTEPEGFGRPLIVPIQMPFQVKDMGDFEVVLVAECPLIIIFDILIFENTLKIR